MRTFTEQEVVKVLRDAYRESVGGHDRAAHRDDEGLVSFFSGRASSIVVIAYGLKIDLKRISCPFCGELDCDGHPVYFQDEEPEEPDDFSECPSHGLLSCLCGEPDEFSDAEW